MAKKKILLRLYNPHDIDLISLMSRHQMDIVKAIYCAITAFAKKESFVIKIPPLREQTLNPRRIYSRHLILDSEKDKKVVQLLDAIDPGYRNNFLKNILRLYLFHPATEIFFSDKRNIAIFEEHYQCLTQGKRYVNAAVFKEATLKNTSQIKYIDSPPKEKSSVFSEQKEHIEENVLSASFSVAQPMLPNSDTPENESQNPINVDPIQSDESLPGMNSQMQTNDDLTDLFTALLG